MMPTDPSDVWFVVREETNPEFLPADRGDKKETYYR
jgi:hypothetical protein